MSQTSCRAYSIQQLRQLARTLPPALEVIIDEDTVKVISDRLDNIIVGLEHGGEDALQDGQLFICQIIGNYPQLTPMITRDLLWFFGGDCLHFMPDEELEKFQQLDEQQAEAVSKGEHFDWSEARTVLNKAD
ncbi:PA2817 family protein [Endozoicomonadaceae bacterium StTr2]